MIKSTVQINKIESYNASIIRKAMPTNVIDALTISQHDLQIRI
ncbi:hypothetical protein [Abyssisolibacter fermentans]|nr:hypothetical protein [Abyssisolibacter fermentans]